MNKNGFSGVKIIGYDHNWIDASGYPIQLVRLRSRTTPRHIDVLISFYVDERRLRRLRWSRLPLLCRLRVTAGCLPRGLPEEGYLLHRVLRYVRQRLVERHQGILDRHGFHFHMLTSPGSGTWTTCELGRRNEKFEQLTDPCAASSERLSTTPIPVSCGIWRWTATVSPCSRARTAARRPADQSSPSTAMAAGASTRSVR